MKSIFLVWKDKNCNGENPEWIHMTAKEFFEFKQKPENSERKFVQVEDKNLSSKYSVIFIEANKELYKKCNAEHSEDMRRKEEKKKYPRRFVSLDKLRGDDSDTDNHERYSDNRWEEEYILDKLQAVSHPSKNGHIKATKNGMNRSISFVFERRPHLFHGSLDNEPLPT